MDITTIGFDLAKTVFQVHGADGEGRAVLRRKLRRGKVLGFFAGLPSCLVGMEACASAHYWAREIQALGHEVRLIPPQYVRPFVKTNKNDAADAEAICEAVTRPTMRLALWLSSSIPLRPGSSSWRRRFWLGTDPTRRAAGLRRSPASVSSPRRRWSRRSEMARSFARAGSSRPGSVWCPGSTRVAARTGWGGSRSAGMAISGACSCMVREACCAGAAPSRARGLAGPTGSWRGGRQTSCWSPWPIRQPASPGHCSDTSVSTDRRPPDQLESGYKLARVTTI